MNIIETHDLCKQYGNALRVAHLDLDVPEGSVYGFLGPNGAGKSTTLKMILGLVRPTAGSIRVLGKSMDSKNRLAVLRQVGSLIESPSYYGHLTGEENLRVVQTLRGLPEKDVYDGLLKTDAAGYIEASEDGATSVKGVFAAGDVRTKQLRQVITAVSDGANCITSVERYLAEQ